MKRSTIVWHGGIALSLSFLLSANAHAAGDEGYFLNSSRWTTNKIPVCWENGSAATAADQAYVKSRVMQTWDAASAVSFTGWGNCTASTTSGIRILIEDSGPHVKRLGNGLNNLANGMVLNFTFSNWSPVCASTAEFRELCIGSNAIHEFGHALGIAHEHNRPDRDPAHCVDAPQGTNGDVIIGAFDDTSIMNYCFNSSYTNRLSETDRATINSMYPKDMVDFNGDGRTDIALTGGTGWSTVPVAFSTGTGTFSVTNAGVANLPGWSRTAGVRHVSGDFNNDGHTDIAVTGGTGWTAIGVAFSNGDGTFNVTAPALASFPQWATNSSAKVIKGDFNGDGFTDIALVGGSGWGSIPVAFSNGNGTFSVTNAGVANMPGWVATAGAKLLSGDFNGDGRTDLAVTGAAGWGAIGVALSNGNGTFNVTAIPAGSFPGWTATADTKVITGDFNADGRTDIMVTGGAGWTTAPVALSVGDGSFTVVNGSVGASFNSWVRTAGVKIAASDLNGDGRTDLALSGGSGWPSIPTLLAQGNGSWVVTNQSVSNFPAWAANPAALLIMADFNRDRSWDLGLVGGPGWTLLPAALSTSGGNFSVTAGASAFAGWASTSGVTVIRQNP